MTSQSRLDDDSWSFYDISSTILQEIYRQNFVRLAVFALVRLLVRPWPYRVAPATVFPIPCWLRHLCVRFSCWLALVPCFLLFDFRFFFLPFLTVIFSCIRYVIFFVSLRLRSSHLLLSASAYFIICVLSVCVFCTLPHLGNIFLFFFV